MMMPRLLPLLAIVILNALPPAVGAQSADSTEREQPVSIEANRGSIDNRNNVHIFEGGVVLTQGSLVIRCEKLVVTQDASGFQHGVATGGADGRASFRQRRTGSEELVEGRAEKIEYDSRSERAVLTGRAEVKSGRDEVQGEYIEYDGKTETYLVTNSSSRTGDSTSDGRVRAVIQPRESSKGKSEGR